MAIHAKDDFDDLYRRATLKKIGDKDWNKRVKKTIAMLHKVFFFDHLYLGGGNSRQVKFSLPRNVSIVSNDAGMEGGAFVWLPKTGVPNKGTCGFHWGVIGKAGEFAPAPSAY